MFEDINMKNEDLLSRYIESSDKLYCYGNYEGASIGYHKALHLSKILQNTKIEAYLYNKLGKCKMCSLDNLDALAYFNQSYNYSKIINDKNIIKNSLYNISLCYKKMGEYDKAIRYINDYFSNFIEEDDIEFFTNAVIVKSNCFIELHKYEEAINTYNKLLKKFHNPDFESLGYIYNNLGMIYLELNNIESSLHYFNKSQTIRAISNSKTLCNTLIEKSRVYIKIKIYEEAINLLNKGYELALQNKQNSYVIKSLCLFEDIYTKNNDDDKLENLYIKLIDFLKHINNNSELSKVYIKLANLYINQNKISCCKKILQELLTTI